MVGLLMVNVAAALLVLGTSHQQATQNALEFYPSTLITMWHAAAAAAVAFVGLMVKRIAFLFLTLSSILLIALPVSCYASESGFAGGDDGGAFGWMFRVGLATLVALIVGAVTAVIGLGKRGSKPKSPPNEDR